MGGLVSRMEKGRSAFKIITGKPVIRMDIKEIGGKTRNWIDSAQVRDYRRSLVNAALNSRVP